MVDASGDTYTVLERTSRGDVHTLHFSAAVTDDDSSILAESLLRPQWPVDQPGTWSHDYRGISGTGLMHTADQFRSTFSTTGAIVHVTVPAGAFETVQLRVRECNITHNVCGDADAWYARPPNGS